MPSPAHTWTSTYTIYLFYLGQLTPLQRAVLLLNLQKAHYQYAQRVKHHSSAIAGLADESTDGLQDVPEVRSLLQACSAWSLVERQEEESERELAEWSSRVEDGKAGLEIVHIG